MFHFLSLLFLDICVCVQNNKLHDAALLRGNTGPLATEIFVPATGQNSSVL